MPVKFTSLVGQTFGLLTAIEHVGFNERRQAMYRVACSCGEIRIVRASDMLTGKTRTCGADCKKKNEWKIRGVLSVTVVSHGEINQTRFGK